MSEYEAEKENCVEQNNNHLLTECDRCGKFFDAKRRCVGDPFRCSFCGEKHNTTGININHPTRLESRVKRLLRAEDRDSAVEKVSKLGLGSGRDTDNSSLYLIKNGEGLTKIGISKTPSKRVYSLQTASSMDVWLRSAFEIDRARRVEKELHSRFDDQKRHGEWFDLSENTLTNLEQELATRADGAELEKIATGTSRSQLTLTAERY